MRDGQGNCACRTSEYFSAERYSTPSVSVLLRTVVVMFCTVLVKRVILLDGRWMFRVEGDIVIAGHGDTPPFVICVRRKSQLAASLHPSGRLIANRVLQI